MNINALDIYTRLEGFGGTVAWSFNGIFFTATAPYMTPDEDGYGVTITASDSQGDLPTDNPYQFFFPFVNIVTDIDKYGNVTVEYNAVEAFKQQVYDAVVTVAKTMGWTPA